MKDLIVEKYMNFINWIRPEKRKLKTFAQKVTKTYFIALTAICILLLPILKLPSSYNELGDFLAGIFSPVAFFWLVIGYLMQHEELQLNRKSLNQQLKEFSNSVKISEENLALQRQIHEEKIESEKKSNLPILHIMDVKPDQEKEGQLSITIKNIGKEITNISFTDNKSVIAERYDFSVLSRFDEIVLKVIVNIKEYNNIEYHEIEHSDPRLHVQKLIMYFNDSRNFRMQTELDIFFIMGEENSFYAEFMSFANSLIVGEAEFGY